MNQILRGEPMTIFGDGTQTRAFSYIGDVAPVMAGALEHEAAWNQVFNIGADRPFTLNELAERVAAAMGVAPNVVHLAPRHEVAHAHSDHGRLERAFGARATTSLDDGLRAMAAWVKAHGARESAPFRGIEVTKNLPAAWRDR
jgi:UDP-glucose 4-epimerase